MAIYAIFSYSLCRNSYYVKKQHLILKRLSLCDILNKLLINSGYSFFLLIFASQFRKIENIIQCIVQKPVANYVSPM